jgi:hypothetical protein
MLTHLLSAGGLLLLLLGASTQGHPMATAQIPPDACVRHEVTLVSTPGTERDRHDQTLAAELGQRISALMRGREDHERGRIRSYGIPGHPRHMLASDIGPDGLRFVHLREHRGELAPVWAGGGYVDSLFLDPVFFRCRDRVVILANTGDYGSWGLAAYLFQGGSVRHLGHLDAAANPPPSTPAGGPLDPLPFATLRTSGDEIIVEFDVDIVLHPETREARLMERSGAPIRFVHREGEFVLEGETRGPWLTPRCAEGSPRGEEDRCAAG